jgi:hypothetical protein
MNRNNSYRNNSVHFCPFVVIITPLYKPFLAYIVYGELKLTGWSTFLDRKGLRQIPLGGLRQDKMPTKKQYTENPQEEKTPYTEAQLPTFSPFKLMGRKQLVGTAIGKNGPFESYREVLTIHPLSAPSNVNIDVAIYEKQWLKLRAVIDLMGGAEKAAITATYNNANPPEIIYTAKTID